MRQGSAGALFREGHLGALQIDNESFAWLILSNSYAYIESNVQYVPPRFGLPSVYLTAAAFCPCQGTSSGLVDTVLVCWLQYNTVPASSDCRKCLNVKGGDGLTGV